MTQQAFSKMIDSTNSTTCTGYLHPSMSSYGSTHTLLIASAIMLSWYPRAVLVYLYRSVSILKSSLMKVPSEDARNARMATVLLRESSVILLVVLYFPVLYVWRVSHAVIATSRRFNRMAFHSSKKYILPKVTLGRRVRWSNISPKIRMSEWKRVWLARYHHERLHAYTKKMTPYAQYLQRMCQPPRLWRQLWKQTLHSWRSLTHLKGKSFNILNSGGSLNKHSYGAGLLYLNPKEVVLSLARLCLGYAGRSDGYGGRQGLYGGYVSQQPKYDVLKKYNTRLALYRKVPTRTMSRLWGKFNRLELPVWLRHPALRLYIWMFGCKLEEAAVQDLTRYRNLCEFFQRKLKPGLRPIDGVHILTSPADGKILYFGKVDQGHLEQVKGVTYSLEGFLGPTHSLVYSRKQGIDNNTFKCSNEIDTQTDSLSMNGGLGSVQPSENVKGKLLVHKNTELYYCIIYLAPGDYHRFHSPADWTCFARRHFPGELFSVNPGVARWLQGLFTLNERVVYTGRWRHGFFSFTPVGATNVGSINVYFDKDLNTNVPQRYVPGSYDERTFTHKKRGGGVQMTKGSLIGDFNLGSTIVLVFEAPTSFSFKMKPGQTVKYGQPLGGLTK